MFSLFDSPRLYQVGFIQILSCLVALAMLIIYKQKKSNICILVGCSSTYSCIVAAQSGQSRTRKARRSNQVNTFMLRHINKWMKYCWTNAGDCNMWSLSLAIEIRGCWINMECDICQNKYNTSNLGESIGNCKKLAHWKVVAEFTPKRIKIVIEMPSRGLGCFLKDWYE